MIYLSRSGRSTVDIVSKNISVPKSFLEQIARSLRLSGVIHSIRGPSGGYELNINSTIGDVLTALKQDKLIDPRDLSVLKRGALEHRALARTVEDLNFAQAQVFTRRITDVVRELVAAEHYMLERTAAMPV